MEKFNIQIAKQDKAAMLNAYKDELAKLSTSLPREYMSLPMHMLAYSTTKTKIPNMDYESYIRKLLEEDSVRAERKERKKKVNERLRRIHLSDEQRSHHFVQRQKVYELEVSEFLLELEEWYDDFMVFMGRTPNKQDFAKKFNEIEEELKALDSRISPDLLFKDGPDDVTHCGRILIKNETKWGSTGEQKAVCLMSALQSLIRKRNKSFYVVSDAGEDVDLPPAGLGTNEDEELVKVYMQLCPKGDAKNLTVNNHNFSRGQMLTAIMHMYQEDKKSWANNASQFSKKLIECLPTTKNLSFEQRDKKLKAIAKRINRETCDIKELHLKDLSVENIVNKKGFPKSLAIEINAKWKELYPYVLQCRDKIRRQQGDKEETEDGQ